MLTITIPALELYDEQNELFITLKEQKLELEHSLISLSKWESKWCKAFFSKQEKTAEETIDYIKCMTLTENLDSSVYNRLTNEHIKAINNYLQAPMTATTFYDDKNQKRSREIVTSELIYYWMIALNIPMECQYWHLNRLFTLIRVCNIKNQPPKKMGRRATAARYAELNAARRARLNTKG